MTTKRRGQKYLREGGMEAVTDEKRSKKVPWEKERRERKGEGGGQDQEARWVLRDPEVSSFILLFVQSSGCYATENWLLSSRSICSPLAKNSRFHSGRARRRSALLHVGAAGRATHAVWLFHLIILRREAAQPAKRFCRPETNAWRQTDPFKFKFSLSERGRCNFIRHMMTHG